MAISGAKCASISAICKYSKISNQLVYLKYDIKFAGGGINDAKSCRNALK